MSILLIILMLGTLGVLIAGLVTMARSGQKNRERSNRLMVARVILQGLAIITLLVIVLLVGK